jgi:hypothetical protein
LMWYDISSYVDLLRRKHRPEDKGLHWWWMDNWWWKSCCDADISLSAEDDMLMLIRCLFDDCSSLSSRSLSMESKESRTLHSYNSM